MEIAKVWKIIWHNEPFHWTIAFVLIIAIIIELCTLWQYWRSECGTTEAGIKFLNNLKKGKNVKPLEKDIRWLKDHLGTDDSSRFREQDGYFILIKYPSVLAQPIPRNSLRFVTTLCTAIGLLIMEFCLIQIPSLPETLQQRNYESENTALSRGKEKLNV